MIELEKDKLKNVQTWGFPIFAYTETPTRRYTFTELFGTKYLCFPKLLELLAAAL